MLPSELKSSLLNLATKLRLGRHVEACLAIVDLLDLLLPRVINDDAVKKQQFQVYLKEILMAQERQDWLCMADYLEYEIVALFDNNPLN
jgi:hypothetical protein